MSASIKIMYTTERAAMLSSVLRKMAIASRDSARLDSDMLCLPRAAGWRARCRAESVVCGGTPDNVGASPCGGVNLSRQTLQYPGTVTFISRSTQFKFLMNAMDLRL